MSVHCPHCSQEVAFDPDFAGQAMTCPNCDRSFTMPDLPATVPPAAIVRKPIGGQLMPPVEFQPQPQPQPTFVVVHSGQSQPRLQAEGWFTRSFASASGVILAIMLIFVALPAVTLFACCGGLAAFAPTDSQLQDMERAANRAGDRASDAEPIIPIDLETPEERAQRQAEIEAIQRGLDRLPDPAMPKPAKGARPRR